VRRVLAAFVLVALLSPAASAKPATAKASAKDVTTNFSTSRSFSGWSAFEGKDASKSNIDFIPEGARLWVRNGKGAAMGLKNPIKYGEWKVKMKISGSGTKVCLLLWPYGDGWPPEIDFNESGDRTKSNQTMHYSSSNNMIQTHYAVDQTKWHIYGVRVRENTVAYTLDGRVMATVANMAPSQSWNLHIRTVKTSSTSQNTQLLVAWASEDAW
jgi:opacity protein-like surface antigen